MFVGNYYEVSGTTVTKYYYAGASRIAMRQGDNVYYLPSDQLGSTTITANGNGGLISELRYKAWGEVRYSYQTTPTDYTYTGQYSNVADFGLMFYNARWYDPALGRMAQADTIVPDGVQGYDRYAYVNNVPTTYADPTGHRADCGTGFDGCDMPTSVVPPKEQHDKTKLKTTTTTGTNYNWYARLQEFSSLFNWSLTSPGEVTLYQTQGYPYVGGARLFWQPVVTQNNGSPMTVGPTSLSSGSLTATFSGEFRYKEGLNSISAWNISAPGLQPWALKVSVQIDMPGNISQRLGAEYTARPDNWSYVAASAGAYATYGLGAAFLARASTAASNGVPVTP